MLKWVRVLTSATMIAAAATSVLFAAPALADPEVENSEDESFLRGLDESGVLFNFNLEKYQGQRYCAAVIDGVEPLDALYDLMRSGDYSFDEANAITASAMVAYCRCSVLEAEGIQFDVNLCQQWETNYRRGDY